MEIYSVEEQIWVTGNLTCKSGQSSPKEHPKIPLPGNPFPIRIRWPAVAQYRNSFLVVGGYQDTVDGDAILDTVFEYDALGDSWKLLPENMTYARYGATAITVPTTVFPDCEQ